MKILRVLEREDVQKCLALFPPPAAGTSEWEEMFPKDNAEKLAETFRLIGSVGWSAYRFVRMMVMGKKALDYTRKCVCMNLCVCNLWYK
jgi:hypothetical protein